MLIVALRLVSPAVAPRRPAADEAAGAEPGDDEPAAD